MEETKVTQSEEKAVDQTLGMNVTQVLTTRRQSLIDDLQDINKIIAQIKKEYSEKLEELETNKRGMEEALQHVIALLKFENPHLLSNEITSTNQLANEANALSLTDSAYEILAKLHEPQHYKELSLKLIQKGINIPGKDPAATLLSRMSRDKRFKRAQKRGLYALATWRLRSKRKKRSKVTRKKE